MKRVISYLLLLLAASLTGCKQNDYMDWKLMNELWMQQNLEKEGVIAAKSGSGLQYTVLYQGNTTDAKPFEGSNVVIDYETSLINGRVIDTGKGVNFMVANLVKGVQEGLKMMNVHGDYILYIPWELAYGDEGGGSSIPPYSTIIFKVHLSAVAN